MDVEISLQNKCPRLVYGCVYKRLKFSADAFCFAGQDCISHICPHFSNIHYDSHWHIDSLICFGYKADINELDIKMSSLTSWFGSHFSCGS